MVASLWINMKLKQDMATLSMPLFGVWQTEAYVAPIAENGKVGYLLSLLFFKILARNCNAINIFRYHEIVMVM